MTQPKTKSQNSKSSDCEDCSDEKARLKNFCYDNEQEKNNIGLKSQRHESSPAQLKLRGLCFKRM